ncbi:ribosomal protein S19E (S16A) [Rhizobium leguminosarum]|uniref:Ribosomal protein S19E (S16A) n=1 Tax=Rhizobium leguminosarum TaxID=384 RepID=A0AAE2MIC6_RHILE|nr:MULTISPECIES: hypothetical protein [Rhizobium]MBB4289654.1 ribosomal protein S19E (S16A) [Rhizobium leguminosarum]MBB4296298.1 ribosomal protein S19E (S16A) [Rhizobium leguminosarum]MBB4308442.1 ribosomal protein S19E (S16A) [Rhizobium leguminosarum]MBB4416278.1 ribosomal protein S19E (S16A) [Rhizobium leguminosarum]MBB4430755.1 ribosomal protein S19E (S16A) [Rhizobium esperanzae]
MTPKEREILGALAWMCEQYISDDNGYLNHKAMHAGELAIEVLAAYGLVEPTPLGDRWTDKGMRLLDES